MNKKHLKADALYKMTKDCFKDIPDHRKNISNIKIPQSDALMSGLAVFALKQSSLLSFEEVIRKKHSIKGKNIRNLFGIKQPASDTQMRDILDPIDPKYLRKPFRKIFASLQRANILNSYRYLDEGYLISVDGTGIYSSRKIKCDDCIKKEHSSGEKTWHHQMLASAVIHPELKTVIPLCPEPISNQDGDDKQDCELKAAGRWVEKFRAEHSKMDGVLLFDGLYPNGPFIKSLQEKNLRFIMGAKKDKLKTMFAQLEMNKKMGLTKKHVVVETIGIKVKKRVTHEFEYINGLDLNASHPDIKVNFLEYKETTEYVNPEQDKKGIGTTVKKFSWITDISLSKENVFKFMRASRGRWKIENETNKTLKEQYNYNIEHSYGHGEQHLCTLLGILAMLSFLIDQAQEVGCSLFKEALKVNRTKRTLWESLRSHLKWIVLDCWETLYKLVAEILTIKAELVEVDTS